MPNHDFKAFPELRNSQMDTLYFESPHKQITEDFRAKVTKVMDGDTIRVETNFRDFDFPIRLLGTNAPELNEGGEESGNWLRNKILGEDVDIIIDRKIRVGKYGRLLGVILHRGVNVNDESMMMGHATTFESRQEGKIPNVNMELTTKKWF